MPSVEKDKLLLRLVAKDTMLCEQLQYKLVDESSTLEDRREEIRQLIDRFAQSYHYSPGYLMMDMRSVNAFITRHVKVTKDKYGEIELTLLLLNKTFEHQLHHMRVYTNKSDTLAAYIAKRAQSILLNVSKLHPDYHIDFEEDINLLLRNVHTYASNLYAKEMNLPKTWVPG